MRQSLLALGDEIGWGWLAFGLAVLLLVGGWFRHRNLNKYSERVGLSAHREPLGFQALLVLLNAVELLVAGAVAIIVVIVVLWLLKWAYALLSLLASDLSALWDALPAPRARRR